MFFVAPLIVASGLCAASLAAAAPSVATFSSSHLRWSIASDATTAAFVDIASGVDYAGHGPIAHVTVAGAAHPAKAATFADGKLSVRFADCDAVATLRVVERPAYLKVEVVGLSGEGATELALLDIPLTLTGAAGEPFAACCLALNLQTNVNELQAPTSHLRALCVNRFGFAGAAAAITAAPSEKLRDAMKQAVTDAPDIPRTHIAGPWALDGPDNRGSYVMNFDGVTAANADEWIARTKSLGFDEVDFHTGGSLRFGDCFPNPAVYPNGYADVKAGIDRLHAAGIKAGLHTYAFFIAKNAPWVTPIPDPRLAKDVTLTLAEALPAEATAVPVVEDTKDMSTITGFFVHNSVTLQIGDELIVYTGVKKDAPFAFTGCTRGAYGTKVAAHPAGAKVGHLKECFGLFVPDPETTLFDEVANATATAYNECGFDMIYLDALDGEAILGGWQYAWHYGSRFAWEIAKRLKRPAIMEMSTFHHHLWYVRARLGAWDHPSRTHKQFIDRHVAANAANERMFEPSNLGWWAFLGWQGIQVEPTFTDDIEYWCQKAIGTDSGLSLTTYDPANPGHQRLGAITKQYEELRRAGYFPQSVKDLLRQPGKEYTLVRRGEDAFTFAPIQYAKHKVQSLTDGVAQWSVDNPHGAQQPFIRIEALAVTGSYDHPGNVTVFPMDDAAKYTNRAVAPGVTAEFEALPAAGEGQVDYGRITATNTTDKRAGTWARFGQVLDPTVNLTGHEAFGVWVLGDGKGEVLNFQLQSPYYISYGISERYITVDFVGWRYFELIESDCDQWAGLGWPYGEAYSIYREHVQFGAISEASIWVNNLPPNGSISVDLRAVRGMSVFEAPFRDPAITVGGKTLAFPVEMNAGQYLEYRGPDDCWLYGRSHEPLQKITPQGEALVAAAGANAVQFATTQTPGINPRARVTLATQGEALKW